jgi:putative hemolysin
MRVGTPVAASVRRIADAYLVTTPSVLAERGIKGLYTSTLFHYDQEFFNHIGPAIELGRSFIRGEYQKHYAPLLLLWKGIAKFAPRHPDCPVLFGAVSISSDYRALSRTLIVNFLNGHIAAHPLRFKIWSATAKACPSWSVNI